MKIYLIAAVLVLLSGCGHQPRTIQSASDIAWTSQSEYMISVSDLPLSDYQKLEKFKNLQHLQLSGDAIPITDAHIKAISLLGFKQLREVALTDCSLVTDVGINYLSSISSIEGLLLRGTDLTDAGMSLLSRKFTRLDGINVENCRKITFEGFKELANSETITSVGMSFEPFSQPQIETLIHSVPNVTRWHIYDPLDKLDRNRLRDLSKSNGIIILIVDNENFASR